eukprot:154992-Rhodomonas_salina.2
MHSPALHALARAAGRGEEARGGKGLQEGEGEVEARGRQWRGGRLDSEATGGWSLSAVLEW